jgi:glucose-6-phosphate isomerase, archaeal
MTFEPGLSISLLEDLSFRYGSGVFGPDPEYRRLDAIRKSLRDPNCLGPDPVYSIAMDVGREEHRGELHRRMLLFGVVGYAAGRLGHEPVRSQGHIHAIAPHCGWSTAEIFEVWQGRAIIYAQERATDDPGRCVAIEAGPGDQVVVPPGWAHCVINANPDAVMLFGAWCDRQYGFDYGGVRAHGGLAWFPLLDDLGAIHWEANPRYAPSLLSQRRARTYAELGLSASVPVYEQFARNPESVQWVSDPARFDGLWPAFEP